MASPMRKLLLVLLVTMAIGCAEITPVEHKDVPSVDPLSGMLNKGIVQLTVNIKGLTKRIAELQQIPDVADPTLRELRALDLAGWQLHQQQWKLQLDYLLFTKEQLRRAKESPAERPQLLEQWTKRQHQYEHALGDLSQQRQTLEQKRFQVEAQLVERSLRGEKG